MPAARALRPLPGAAAPPPPADAPAPPGVALRALALAELVGAAGQLAREGDDRHAGVHQARKRLRRTRALLALGRKRLGEEGRRLDAAIGALCRGLSGLRDGQALVEALERLRPAAGPGLAETLPGATAAAAVRRDALMAMALARDPDFGRRRARIARLALQVAALPWERLDEAAIARALERGARRIDKARRKARRHPDDHERWHALRRRVRRLRQQETLLAPLVPALLPEAKVPVEEATALGEAQDDALLLRHCGRGSPFAPATRRLLRAAAGERLRRARAVLAGQGGD